MGNYITSIDCRSVGPGGTSVDFYPGRDREGVPIIKAIWTNENCPYEYDDATVDPETYESSDGHNVSFLTKEELERMLAALNKLEKNTAKVK
jgi:hypothetical protein